MPSEDVAEKKNTGFGSLQFVFTDSGFLPDIKTEGETIDENWAKRFASDRFAALYDMGLEEKPDAITQSANFLYQLSSVFWDNLTRKPELELAREKTELVLDEDTVRNILDSVPYVIGADYITEKWVRNVFKELKKRFSDEIKDFAGTVAALIAQKTPRLHVAERIYFHLVESKNDKEGYPFAFLATYATKTDKKKTKHMPLKYALTEFKTDTNRLLKLLSCLNRAADVSPLISSFVTSGEMFHPLRLTASEAYSFLKDVEAIEKTGILCRIPNWWRKKNMSPTISVKLGENKPARLGFETLISLQPELIVDGVPLTAEDIRFLLEQTEGLALLKGRWVEVNHDKLRELLKRMEDMPTEVTLMDAIKMGLKEDEDSLNPDVGYLVTNGKWLSDFLETLRKPERLRADEVPKSLHAQLRPYQKIGYTWLDYMAGLGFGACLADDMGLGKTVEVLAYLEKLRAEKPSARVLLIAPASLMGNWQKETMRFAPDMEYLILHGYTAARLDKMVREIKSFLTVTTYGMASRLPGIKAVDWDCVILDEAQAIKNPVAKQTKEIKKIKTQKRIIMTGTPIENDLTNLWSLFDFLNKGLLGTSTEFRDFCRDLDANPEGYARLKKMISPFILRRLKTDKKIISDLPDKVESIDYVSLSKKQVVMYREVTAELAASVTNPEITPMQRRGMVLATITKLKQVCNHPDQYLGQDAYEEKESGKLQLMRKICETILEKRERVIVFTQFKEITGALSSFLKDVFGKEGFVLHGGTPVKKRTQMVEAFQSEEYIPYMVISLKAGGFGLNLTKANHVIHFDRWWNPAVENQATDRTYRIGQKNTVIVHKLVCEGTVEEKIDEIINSKTELAENVIGSSGEQWITELDTDELMSLLKLENTSCMEEERDVV
ncbi:MAG: DEAD/DEAH box helicase [Clostridia bacterium]|nr:DEAD/DEAH box helicase [Clostridia bacterium]